jgi:seryl-tRNA synthetase
MDSENKVNANFVMVKSLASNRLQKIKELTTLVNELQNQIIELSEKVSTMIVNDINKIPKNISESEYYDKIIANLEEENSKLKSENNCYYYQNNSLKQMITSENIIDSITCVICNDNQRNVLFKPCNHLVICDTCSGKTDIQKCIICNQYIDCFEYAYII